MVGAERFELPTLCSQSRCATRLRYAPTLYKLSKIFSKISLTKICMDYLNFLFLCLDSRPTSSTDFRYLEGETLIVIFPSLLTLLTSNCKLFITGSYYIETSPLICSLNQWTGFFMLGTSVVKEVKSLTIIRI